jgi:two-component system, OmpR family, phosphate regulon sensor histidine kinase PhoR
VAGIFLLVGLALGAIAGVAWSRTLQQQHLRSLLGILQGDRADSVSLSLESQLRRVALSRAQELQNREAQLHNWEQIFQNAPLGYLHLGDENQILWCNRQARALLKIPDGQLQRQRLFLEIVRSYELDRAIQDTRRSGIDRQLEWQYHPNYGDDSSFTDLAIALKASLIALPNHEVGIFLESQQVVAEFHRLRERWTSDLAHELQTPLTAIRLAAETAQVQIPEDSKPSRWLGRILQETDRLARLVKDFLELSRLEEDPSQRLDLHRISLQEVVEKSWQTLETVAQQRQITLQVAITPGLELTADPQRLGQVLINLLDNGIRYSPSGSTLKVSAQIEFDQVHIEVLDRGQGFALADLPYVFDRFFRGDPSRQQDHNSSPTNGNGLGLAIVRQIILAHQGTIIAGNHPDQGGGWIQVYLPLAPVSTP